MVVALFICCVPCIALCIALLGYYKNPKNWRMYSVLYVGSIAVLAYTFALKEGDLVRYYSWLEYYEGNLGELFKRVDDGLYLQTALFWIVKKTGDKNLLQAITTGIVYGSATYITCDAAERKRDSSGLFFQIVLQALFLPFVSIVSNVRNITAFALIVVAVYRDVIQKRRGLITLAFYVMPCFLHTAAIVLILIRFLTGFFQKNKPLIVLGVFFTPLMIEVLYRYVNVFSFLPVLSRMIIKMHGYLVGSDSINAWATEVANSSWQKVYKLCFLVYIILLVFYIYRNAKSKMLSQNENAFCTYGFLLGMLTLASLFFSTPQYWRFGAALTFVQGAIITTFNINGKKNADILIYRILWVMGAACTVLNLYRLPSQVEIGEWLWKYLLCNPYEVIWNAICRL